MAHAIKQHKMAFYDNALHMPYDILVNKYVDLSIYIVKRRLKMFRVQKISMVGPWAVKVGQAKNSWTLKSSFSCDEQLK